jgi:hypothetical protein
MLEKATGESGGRYGVLHVSFKELDKVMLGFCPTFIRSFYITIKNGINRFVQLPDPAAKKSSCSVM